MRKDKIEVGIFFLLWVVLILYLATIFVSVIHIQNTCFDLGYEESIVTWESWLPTGHCVTIRNGDSIIVPLDDLLE